MDGMINIKLNHQEGQYYRPWDKTWRNSGCIFFPEISIFPYTPWISSLLDFFCTFIFKIGLGLLHTKKALGNYGKYWKLNFPTTLQKTIFVPRTTGNPGYTPNTMMLRYCTLFRVWCTIYIKNSSSGGEHGNLEIEEEHGKNALDIVLHVLIKGRNEMDWMLNPIMTRL